VKLVVDSIGLTIAILCNASPDLKEVILRLGRDLVNRRHQGFCSARHAALRFSISARDSSAEKNSPRSNWPKARSIFSAISS
jgi:hypothetical protein